MNQENELRHALAETNPDFDFATSDDFVRDGGLDSFQIVILINELEKATGVVIPGDLILPEYFSSIASLQRLLVDSMAARK